MMNEAAKITIAALAQRTLVADGLHRAAIQPGQHEHDRDRRRHGNHEATELVRHGAQHRVEGRVVPDRRNVRRSLQRVGFLEVRELEEVTAHPGAKKMTVAEHEQEHHDADEVMHRVVGVERNAVERLRRWRPCSS
jgi:hypothetical protein